MVGSNVGGSCGLSQTRWVFGGSHESSGTEVVLD